MFSPVSVCYCNTNLQIAASLEQLKRLRIHKIRNLDVPYGELLRCWQPSTLDRTAPLLHQNCLLFGTFTILDDERMRRGEGSQLHADEARHIHLNRPESPTEG
jgi:hypothetical protein